MNTSAFVKRKLLGHTLHSVQHGAIKYCHSCCGKSVTLPPWKRQLQKLLSEVTTLPYNAKITPDTHLSSYLSQMEMKKKIISSKC